MTEIHNGYTDGEDLNHFVVEARDVPATALLCNCGTRVEGPDCIEVMRSHIEEGNGE